MPRLAAVAGLCRVLVGMRLAMLVLSVGAEVQDRQRIWVLVAQAGAGVATALVLVNWREGTSLFGRPWYMVLDVTATVVTLGVTGTEGPFFSYTLGTAALVGALFGRRGAVLSSVALVAGYWAVLLHESGLSQLSFQELFGRPVLYPAFAVAGAALRRLLYREAEALNALHVAYAQVAAEHERARLARDLHDFLGKTLTGISLGATGLVMLIDRDPGLARKHAQELASAAEAATRDARKLVGELRTDRAEGSLADAVRATASEWERGTGLGATVDVDDCVRLSNLSRHELMGVLNEALRNVARHAEASGVQIAIRCSGPDAEMRVADDGRGIGCDTDDGQLQAVGKYGIVGMRERVLRVGGHFAIETRDGAGTTVVARVPVSGEDSAEPVGGGSGRRTNGHSRDR